MRAAPGPDTSDYRFVTAHMTLRRLGLAWWACLGLVTVAWLLAFNQQRLEWSVDPTYAYGWAVPLLAAYLFRERWRTRPASFRPAHRGWWLLVPALLLLCYLPVRAVQEANPDWVKINWTMAAILAGISLSAVHALAGGRGLRYCVFPVLFCFTALPWPVWIQDTVTKSLMHGNASAAAELLTIAGHPALARGNLILIGSTWVDIEEACSGIRSLQTAFMVALFLGEFHRLGWLSRGLLLLASFAMAFLLNFARTLVLTYLGGVGGNALTEKWHDVVGNAAMILCLAAWWGLAELFQRRRLRPPPESAPRPDLWLEAPFPLWFAVAGLAWFGVSEAATAGWYAYHERNAPAPIAWDVRWPSEQPGFHLAPLGERARVLLKYNEGHIASWRSAGGLAWQMYYLRWQPGRVSKFLAGGHYPTVCLPANGLRLVAETGPFVCEEGALPIPFVSYLFDDAGRDLYVFHAIIEDNEAAYADRVVYRQADSMERLRSALRGERNLGQRVIGIAVSGALNLEDARARLRAMLAHVIVTPPAARLARGPGPR